MSNGKAPNNSIEKDERSKKPTKDSLNNTEKEAKKDSTSTTKFEANKLLNRFDNVQDKQAPSSSKATSTFLSPKIDVVQKETCKKSLPPQKPVVSQKETCTKLLPYDNNKNKDDESTLPDQETSTSGTIKKTAKLLPIFQVDKKDVFKATHLQVQDVGYDKTKKAVKIYDQNKLPKIEEETKHAREKVPFELVQSSELQRYLISKLAKLSGAPIEVDLLPKQTTQTAKDMKKVEPIQTTRIDDKAILKKPDKNSCSGQKHEPKSKDLNETDTTQIERSINKSDTIKPAIDREGLIKDEPPKMKTDIAKLKEAKDGKIKKTDSKDFDKEKQDKKEKDKTLAKDNAQLEEQTTSKDKESLKRIKDVADEQFKLLELSHPDLDENKLESLLSSFGSIEAVNEALKLYEQTKADNLLDTTESDKLQFKIKDLTSEQFESLQIAFADFKTESYDEEPTDSGPTSGSALEASKNQDVGKIDKSKDVSELEPITKLDQIKAISTEEKLYQATYIIRNIPEDMPESYKLFNLSELTVQRGDENLEVPLKTQPENMSKDFDLSDGSKFNERLIQTDIIKESKPGCSPTCGKESRKYTKTERPFKPEEEVIYYSARIKELPEEIPESYKLFNLSELTDQTEDELIPPRTEADILKDAKPGCYPECGKELRTYSNIEKPFKPQEKVIFYSARIKELTENVPEPSIWILEDEGVLIEEYYAEEGTDVIFQVATIRQVSIEVPQECISLLENEDVVIEEYYTEEDIVILQAAIIKQVAIEVPQESIPILEREGVVIEEYYTKEDTNIIYQAATIKQISIEVPQKSIPILENEGIIIEEYYTEEDIVMLQAATIKQVAIEVPQESIPILEHEGVLIEEYYTKEDSNVIFQAATIKQLSLEVPLKYIELPKIEGIIIKSYIIDEPIYAIAKISEIKTMEQEKQLGVNFEPKEGTLIERDDIKPPAPYYDPPKYHISKYATLSEYDYFYESIGKEKKIKKIEVQIAHRMKIKDKPQFGQALIQKDKIIKYINLRAPKEDENIAEIHKTTVRKQPKEKAETSNVLPSKDLKEVVLVESYYKKHKKKIEQIHIEATQLDILKRTKLSAGKFEVLTSPVGKAITFVDSFYHYERPIFEELTHQRADITKILEDVPEHEKVKISVEKEFKISRKQKDVGEKSKAISSEQFNNADYIDSSYIYEQPKPIMDRRTISKSTTKPKTDVNKNDKVEEAIEIKTLTKISGVKAGVLPSQIGKDAVFTDSFYKYEKPFTIEPTYQKVTKTKVLEEKPDQSQHKAVEKELVISIKTRETSEKIVILPSNDLNNTKYVDSYYKYENPIVVEPIYQKVTKTQVAVEKPQQSEKKVAERDLVTSLKNMETAAKMVMLPSQDLKNIKYVDSFYKYEKPIVVEPIYQKVTKTQVLVEKPEQTDKKEAEKELVILLKNREPPQKIVILPSNDLKNIKYVDSYYKYEKPIVLEPIYQKVTKAKVPEEKPEQTEKKAAEKELIISLKNKETPEKIAILPSNDLKNIKYVDSYYKYEKQVVVEPIYQKVTKAKVPEEKPEQTEKKAAEKELIISLKNKETPEKIAILPSNDLKNIKYVDSYYKYEKPIVLEPIYQKVTKAKVPEGKPEQTEKKAAEKELVISLKNRETPEKITILPSNDLKNIKYVDSYYKYEKPVVVEPIYQKVAKTKALEEKPQQTNKKATDKELVISLKNKETPEKIVILPSNDLKNIKYVDSYYKYEKPVVVEPIYQKVTKAKVPEEKPKQTGKKEAEKELVISLKNKETPEKNVVLPSKYLENTKFVDSFYKYEKEVVVKPIYQKVTKTKVLEEKPGEAERKAVEKEFRLTLKNIKSSEKNAKLPTKDLENIKFVDSYYKYEKPIVVKPIYQKVTKTKVPEEKPGEAEKKAAEKEFRLTLKNIKSSEKMAILPSKDLENTKFVDSYYKYEKPIGVKPIYQKATKTKIPEEKPGEAEKKAAEKEFRLKLKNIKNSEKIAILPSKDLENTKFVDSYYKYEKPVVVKPIYQKATKTKIPEEKPGEAEKKAAEKEFRLKLKNIKNSEKIAILPSKDLENTKFVDSYYKYEKPIVVKPIYQKATKTKIPEEKPREAEKKAAEKEFRLTLKNIKSSEKMAILPSKDLENTKFVDSYYKYEKPVVVKPIYQKATKTKISEEKPGEAEEKAAEKEFRLTLKNIKSSEKITILPSKDLENTKYVDSYYKYEKPIVVKPIYQKATKTKIPEEKPGEAEEKAAEKEFRLTLKNIKSSEKMAILPSKDLENTKFVDSYYKYEKPVVVKPIYQKATKTKIPEEKPGEAEKKEAEKEFRLTLKNIKSSEKMAILPSKDLEKTKFVDSYYEYEKPIVVKPIYQKATKTKIPEEKPGEAEEKAAEKEFRLKLKNIKSSEKMAILPSKDLENTKFVDSYYKYEKPIVVKPIYQKATKTKIPEEKPGEAEKKAAEKEFRLTLKNIKSSEKMAILPSKDLENTKFVDSYYKYEKPVVVKPIYQKATKTKIPEEKPGEAEKKEAAKELRLTLKNIKSSEKMAILPSKDLENTKFVDSYYKYEKPIVVKPIYQKATKTKIPEEKPGEAEKKEAAKEFRLTLKNIKNSEKMAILPSKDLENTKFVDSYYKYEKLIVVKPIYQKATKTKIPEEKPGEAEKIAAKKEFRLTLKNIKISKQIAIFPSKDLKNTKFVDSYYKYEKPIVVKPTYERITKTKVPVSSDKVLPSWFAEKPLYAKIQEVPNYITKIKKPKIHFVDSVYRYENPKDVKAVIEPVFEKATVTKTEEMPDQRRKIKGRPESKYADSSYKYEKRHKEPIQPMLHEIMTVNKSQIARGKTNKILKELAHMVDSNYKYEPPEKGLGILESINIQTATIIQHALDQPEYNALINEHDAIWFNFVFEFEKIRPEVLRKLDKENMERATTQRKLPNEKPEKNRTPADHEVHKIVKQPHVPSEKKQQGKSIKVPDFNIIPHAYKEDSHSLPGPSKSRVESRKSSSSRRDRDEAKISTWPSTTKKQTATITCPNCNNVTELRATAENTDNTHLMAVMLAPVMLCFVPYLLKSTKKLTYKCTFCNAIILKPPKKDKQ